MPVSVQFKIFVFLYATGNGEIKIYITIILPAVRMGVKLGLSCGRKNKD
jgi:hypothetical protein